MKQKQAFDGPPRSRPHCPACDRFAEAGDVVHCPGCGSPYHPGCAQRLSGCRTPGCTHAPAGEPHVSAAPRSGADPTCPYCRTATASNPVACSSCGTRYHRSCATALGVCATLGCQAQIHGHVIEQVPLRERLSEKRSRYDQSTRSEGLARRRLAKRSALAQFAALPQHVALQVLGGIFGPMLLTFVVLYLLSPHVRSSKILVMFGGWILGGVVLPFLIPALILWRFRRQQAQDAAAPVDADRSEDRPKEH